jgi:hypothetical protein
VKLHLEPLFPLCRIVATPACLNAVPQPDLIKALSRHAVGDWGSLDAEDKAANDDAVLDGSRILSSYTSGETVFWIITEADRSVTTFLLHRDCQAAVPPPPSG